MNMSLNDGSFYIFGAGDMGREIVNCLRYFNAHIIGFIDNDSDKYGVKIEGYSVCSLRFTELNDEAYIIISSTKYEEEIYNELSKCGIDRKKIITHREFAQMIKNQSISLMSKYIFNNDSITANGPQILFDHQIFEKQNYGGILRTFYELITNICKMDCSVDFFEGINISRVSFKKESFRRFCAHTEDRLGLYPRSIINRFGFKEFTKGQEYDIYHSTYYDDTLDCNCKKRVITIHDMIPELFWDKSRFVELKKKNIDGADGIVAVSENTKKDLLNIYDIDEDIIRVIYHGNSMRNVEYDPAPMFDFPYILYVGKREDYKNASTLFEAYSKSEYRDEMKLVFFGGGVFSKEEFRIIEELGIRNSVVHVGGDDTKLANAYFNAEVFVYPSKYEGFGIPLLESMWCGCPVIAANSSSIPEVGGNAVRYFDPYNEESLIDALDEVLGNRGIRQKLIQLGKEREKLFSWEKTARETLNFYNELLEK